MSQYRGGRNHWRRGFANRSDQFVTGDSHFRSVRDANLECRQGQYGSSGSQGEYNRQPYYPRPRFIPNQPFHQPRPFNPRPKPLDYRNWEYAMPGPPPHSEQFVVLSYNILADYLAINHRSKLYFHIPRHMLDWEWRKRSILFELGLWSADIMCLQEVDRFQDLELELRHKGYSGIWKIRAGDAVDGCAIFWQASRFKLLQEEVIEFNKLGLRNNVAQICVLELLNQTCTQNTSSLSTSSTGSSKVVICNIHVLYNPKRGEIKLGQVRNLLHRAHVVSKNWNDAPLVVCGDFNCIPKSPLYNFISEQKLDLSGLARDKVSGQASAEICAPWPYSHKPGFQSTNNSVQAPTMLIDKEIKIEQSNLDMDDVPITNSTIYNRMSKEPQQDFVDACENEAESSVCGTVDSLKESHIQSSRDEVKILADDVKEVTPIQSSRADICSDVIETQSGEILNSCSRSNDRLFTLKGSQTSSRNIGGVHVDEIKNGIDEFTPSKPTVPEDINLDAFKLECEGKENVNSHSTSGSLNDLSVLTEENRSPSTHYTCTNIGLTLDENLVNLSLNQIDDAMNGDGNVGEDYSKFLTELHDGEDTLPPENICSPSMDPEPNLENITYNQSLWTPMEIETATGNADCTLIEHHLKLRSTYTEVEDFSGTRDANGEPVVTSYNRCFMGTVDYIWRSEGLQTVGVLAPIPKHAMQWTPGFPTRKWGSDHIALVSILAFTKEANGQ